MNEDEIKIGALLNTFLKNNNLQEEIFGPFSLLLSLEMA